MRVDLEATLRNVAGPVLARGLNVEVRGAHRVPVSGPVILVCARGDERSRLIVRFLLRRPVHLIDAAPGPAVDAQLDAVTRLAAGEVVAFAGDHPRPGFAVLASGAPVIPLEVTTDVVSRSRTLFVGEPSSPPPSLVGADPASLTDTRATSEWVRQLLADFADDMRKRVPV